MLENLPVVDIAIIRAAGFSWLLWYKDNTVFTTSLYKIDRILEEKQEIETGETNNELVARKLPKAYTSYKDAFSKAALDKLPLHRMYNHKIQVEGENNLDYSPLYGQNVKELQATKKYITNNLHKGFIKPSQAPFVSPILFASKSDRSL